jgi:chemotaxis protein methyltransferase CheR
VSFDTGGLGLSRAATTLLRDLVHERTGLYYDDQRMTAMSDRLAPLVANRGFDAFIDYYYFLKYDPAAELEWSRVMDALSVPETYFWREVDQLMAVVEHIIPRLSRSLGRPVRIWCVPCASGEEPLTLAMMLDARGRAREAEIHASDASPAALELARGGLYRERSFRALPAQFRDRYFTPEENRWRIDPRIHAQIRSWTQVNLADPGQVAPHADADIIFCRNVFIYFSEDTIRRVAEHLADRMPPLAYLCVGASESLLRITDRFELEQVADAFVYVKRVSRGKAAAK